MTSTSAPRTDNPARFYEDYLVPTMFRPFAEELVERAAPSAGERVLDVACGTGIVARIVARRLAGDAQITGFDLSPHMLEVAHDAAALEGAEIAWVQGDAQVLPFAGESFDLVLCQQGLQPIPDQVTALREMWRVLAPGGRLLTSTWTAIEHHLVDRMIAESIHRHFGVPAFDVPFSLGDPELLRGLFRSAGFNDVEISISTCALRFPSADDYVELIVVGGIAALPGLQSLDEASSAKLIEAIRADIAGSIADLTEDGELVIPAETTSIAIAGKPA